MQSLANKSRPKFKQSAIFSAHDKGPDRAGCHRVPLVAVPKDQSPHSPADAKKATFFFYVAPSLLLLAQYVAEFCLLDWLCWHQSIFAMQKLPVCRRSWRKLSLTIWRRLWFGQKSLVFRSHWSSEHRKHFKSLISNFRFPHCWTQLHLTYFEDVIGREILHLREWHMGILGIQGEATWKMIRCIQMVGGILQNFHLKLKLQVLSKKFWFFLNLYNWIFQVIFQLCNP